MSINKLFCIILLLLSSYAHAESLSITLNKTSFSAGDLLEISVTSDKTGIDATEADVYLSIQLPDGSLYYWYYLDIGAISTEVVPLFTNLPIPTLPITRMFAFEIPTGLGAGVYKWYLTLAKVGSDVEQPANWIANASVKLELNGKTTNPSRLDLVDEEYSEAESLLEKSADGIYEHPSEMSPPSDADEIYFGADMDDDVSSAISVPSEKPSVGEPILPYPDVIPIAGTLTAGDIDDNLNFTAFKNYRDRQDSSLPFVTMSDRVLLHIIDNNGKTMSNAKVRVDNKLDMYTGTDGRFYLFPKFDGIAKSQINLQFLSPEDEFGSASSVFTTNLDLTKLPADRSLTITIPDARAALPHSLDLMFVIDTTGSMSDELKYLITELRDIINSVQARHKQVSMRFGLIVYRDITDEYVVQNYAFTNSLNNMQQQLNRQKARGGGDYPEAMEQALDTAVNVDWNAGNVARLLFLVADAPPHDENMKAMLESVHVARNKGIRIYPLAASGVGDKAEFMMRNAEVLTQGRYLFLTDDSGVGGSHQEPSTPCYIVTRLDQLIARVIDSELAGKRIEPNTKDIIRSVGDYKNGVCDGKEPLPQPVDELANVENIRVQVMESFPLQVQVVAQGYLSNSCEKINQSTSSRSGDLFTVKITTNSVGEICTEAEEAFSTKVTLDVNGLKAGTYTVDVNGIKDKFKLDVDNI